MNSHTSNFTKHLIEQAHSFSSIQNTLKILQRQSKGAHLNTIERYYIYVEFTKNNDLNDEHTISPNKIFDALLGTPPAIKITSAPIHSDMATLENPPQREKHNSNSTVQIKGRTDSHHITQATIRVTSVYQY